MNTASLQTTSRRNESALRAWLKALDAGLAVIERAAWEIRDQAAEAWQATQGEWVSALAEARGLGRSADEWQRRVARLSQAGWTLTKIASTYRLHITRAAFMSRRGARAALDRLHHKNANRFLDLCLEQGGGFLKAGQALSARPDLLPSAWIETLATLQDEVPGAGIEEILPIVEREFGAPIEHHFVAFDSEPIGTASIGQVHRAELHDGTEVAVKVRRPGVDETIELDMQLLAFFIDGLRASLPEADYDTSIAEIQKMIRSELDYHAERAHGEAIGLYFKNASTLTVPEPVDALCTERLLTTKFVRGEKITVVLDRLAVAREGGDDEAHARLSHILSTVVESYVGQILELGRFQADPHPGNLLIEPGDRVVLLDFGCTKVIDDDVRRAYAKIMQAFFVQDRAGVASQLSQLGFRTRTGQPDTLLTFADILLSELQEHRSGHTEWPSTEELIERLGELMRSVEDDPVTEIPDHFVMIGRVLTTLGGMFMHYRPTLDFQRHLLPVVARALTDSD